MSYNIYENGQLNKIAGRAVMDAELDANSTNGVQNKVVTEAITQLNNDLYKDDNITVTANGVKTTATLLNELWALVDHSKITNTSYIEFNRIGDKLIFEIGYEGNSATRYGHFTVNQLESLNLGTSSTYIRVELANNRTTYYDKSQEVIANGWYFKLYY